MPGGSWDAAGARRGAAPGAPRKLKRYPRPATPPGRDAQMKFPISRRAGVMLKTGPPGIGEISSNAYNTQGWHRMARAAKSSVAADLTRTRAEPWGQLVPLHGAKGGSGRKADYGSRCRDGVGGIRATDRKGRTRGPGFFLCGRARPSTALRIASGKGERPRWAGVGAARGVRARREEWGPAKLSTRRREGGVFKAAGKAIVRNPLGWIKHVTGVPRVLRCVGRV